jgi:predicted nuclease of restriction endonuclease-like (RecB) superfamily
MKRLLPEGYTGLLQDIKDRVRSAQHTALKTVNKELITLYWDIGRMIVEQQKGATWGKAVVERLATDLREEFPGMQGFSTRNLWYMRNFYATYSHKSKLQPLVAEIGWSHNLIILDRCNDNL